MYCIKINGKYALVKRTYGDYSVDLVESFEDATQCKTIVRANAIKGIVEERYPNNHRIKIVEL